MSTPHPPALPETPSTGRILFIGTLMLLIGGAAIWYAEQQSAHVMQAGEAPNNALVFLLAIGGTVAGLGVLLLLGGWRMRWEEQRRRNGNENGAS